MDIKLDIQNLKKFIEDKDFQALMPQIEKAHQQLENKSGKGKEFTGWMELPTTTSDKFINEITKLGEEIRKKSDVLISIGIGGSYAGVRASLEFLSADQKLPVEYAGHNMSVDCLNGLLKRVKNKRVSVVVISKSGTTTEPALAFRVIKKFMEEKYSKKEAQKRIIAVTDQKKGALRKIVDKEGYRSYIIPDDVGGRFSVLTPVGLVPLAIAGIDIKGLIKGARQAEKDCSVMDLSTNVAYQYAAARFLLYQRGKKIEILSTFYPRVAFIAEWWKQLTGESEGKQGKGLFPASLIFSSDLHSMGQLIQDGERTLFETFLMVEKCQSKLSVPKFKEDEDNFNCVAGKDLDYVNKQAYRATAMAHLEGGVPNMTIMLPDFKAATLGQLYYMFEKAVAVTGYLMDVNPFDQPGVEAYKNKMFELLGRK